MKSMKIKDGFVMNKVGSQYVVVPVGQASVERHCMIRLNETGAFLWKCLQMSASENDLVKSLVNEYNVDEASATSDVAAFAETLRSADLLDESCAG